MAVKIPFEAALDSRSASAVADRAERIFADAGRDAGQSFSKQFGATAQSVDADMQKLGNKAKDAYDKAADAAGKLRAEEAKLQDLRDRGARDSQIVAQAGRAESARRAEVRAIRDATDAISDYERVAQNAGRGLRTSMAGAGSELRAGLRAGITDAAQDFTAQFGVMGGVASNAFGSISAGAAGAALGIAGIGAAGLLAGKQLYDLGSTWDNVADSISLRTGKMGSELEYLVGTVKDLSSITAAPLETIGDVAGQVSQNLSGLNAGELQAMVKTLSEFQSMGGEAVDIRGFGNVLDLFDVGPAGAMSALDSLYRASVDTGTSINQLITTMGGAGKTAQQFGLGFGETAALLTTMEEAGLDFSKVAPSLSVALKNIARDQPDVQKGFRDTVTEIRNLIDAGNESQAILAAQETFGRGYADFFQVIKSGKLDVDALSASLDSNGASLDEVLEGTKDWGEEWTQLKNKMSSVFAPAAEYVFGQVNHHLDQAGQALSGFGDWVTGIGHAWEELAALVSGNPLKVEIQTGAFTMDANGNIVPTGQPGAVNDPLGALSGTPGSGTPNALDQALGLAPAAGAPALPLPGIRPNPWGTVGPGVYADWYGQDDAAGGRESLPAAPALPLSYTPTAGMPSGIANATTRLDEARHSVAEKEARVNQLQASNVAKAEDIQKARNDLTRAEQDQMQAEQSLSDAQVKAAEQQTKQVGKVTSDLSDLGASLDADFGLSKGLGGVIENAVKALGNALAAPFLQALGMVEKANPNEGSGLVGMLAANGSFGQQYTPAALAAQQATTGAPGYGNYAPASASPITGSPGAAQPGQSARDFAHETMMPFFQNQGLVVGDHAADKYGEHQNGALDIMVDSIAEGNEVLKQVLADPNVYGAIFNNKAYGYGQGSAPRPYSGGNTGNPTQDHQDHVHALYKPGGAGNISPSGGGGPISVAPTWQGPTPTLPTMAGGAGGMYPGIAPPSAPAFATPGAPTVGVGAGLGQAQPAMPGVGSALGQGQYGPGVAPGSAYPSTGGNSGNAIGGLALDGLMGAAGAMDLMMPGAGAAAKIGIQLANRTIGYGAQNAGILASGVLETLSLGDNPKGSLGASWLGKGIGGLAGAAPALPNIAGGQKPPAPNSQQAGGAAGQGGNTTNQTVNVTNNQANENQNGGVVAEHLSAMQAPAGRQ